MNDHTASRPLRILFAAGPGDVLDSFHHWRRGEDDPSQVAVTYRSQFFDMCRDFGDTALVIYTEAAEQAIRANAWTDGQFTLQRWPEPREQPRGVRWHLWQMWEAVRLAAWAIRFRADVLLITCGTCHWFPLAVLPLFGIRVIPSLHCVLWRKYRQSTRTWRWVWRCNALFFRYCVKAALMVSQDVAGQLDQVTNGRPGTTELFLPSYRESTFADVSNAPHEARPFRVLYIGRVEADKGVLDLITVARRFAEIGRTDVEFDLCGSGSELEHLRKLAADAGIAERFRCHGHLGRDAIRPLFEASHIIIAPTTSNFVEGFNKAVAEGILSNRPVITSAVCPAIKYVGAGVVEVPHDDVKAYGDAILTLMDDRALYESKQAGGIAGRPQFFDRQRSWGAALQRVLQPVRTGRSAGRGQVATTGKDASARGVSLTIVVLNYRTCDLTLDCLRSLARAREDVPGTRVIVVDNGSGDGSAERFAQEIQARQWGSWATVMALAANVGFSAGNNRAIETISPDTDYVLLLNSDTLVAPGPLEYCCRIMDHDPHIGVMSCMLKSPDGSPQPIMRDFPTPLPQFLCTLNLPWTCPALFGWANLTEVSTQRLHRKQDCGWVAGAFFLMRRSALDRVGLLDEDFFFYGEDVEFCHRLHRYGYRVHYDPATSIVHLGGYSSGPQRVNSMRRNEYEWRSRYLLQRKCYGRGAAALIQWGDILYLKLRKLRLQLRRQTASERYREVCQSLACLRALRP